MSAHSKLTLSSMINLLSASTTSSGKRWCRRPLFTVRCTSDTIPPQHFEIKEIDPCGVIPIKNLVCSLTMCEFAPSVRLVFQ